MFNICFYARDVAEWFLIHFQHMNYIWIWVTTIRNQLASITARDTEQGWWSNRKHELVSVHISVGESTGQQCLLWNVYIERVAGGVWVQWVGRSLDLFQVSVCSICIKQQLSVNTTWNLRLWMASCCPTCCTFQEAAAVLWPAAHEYLTRQTVKPPAETLTGLKHTRFHPPHHYSPDWSLFWSYICKLDISLPTFPCVDSVTLYFSVYFIEVT